MSEYDLFASPDGDDRNQGSEAEPLKTLEGAKNILRTYKSRNIDETVNVWFEGGTYYFDKAVSFDGNDYGNVLFRNIPGEEVVFSGSSTTFGNVGRVGIPCMVSRGYYNDAVFADPLFKDALNRNFTLAENSPALNAGFVPFSYDAGTIYNFE